MDDQAARTKWVWLTAAAITPALLLGVRYMTLPYAQLEESGIVMGPGLLVLSLVALVACAAGGVRALPSAAATTMGLIALIMLRVAVDTAIDSTSHNLWPFEVGIALLFGGVASLAGALLGGLARRILPL